MDRLALVLLALAAAASAPDARAPAAPGPGGQIADAGSPPLARGAQAARKDAGAPDEGATAASEDEGRPPTRIRLQGSDAAASRTGSESATSAEIARLRSELEGLRARLAQVERRLDEAERAAEQLRETNRRLQDLTDEVARTNELSVAREQRQQSSMAQLSATIALLQQAQTLLAAGRRDIDPLLARAQVSLRGEAAAAVRDARDRVANGDLFGARLAVGTAINFAVTARLSSGAQAADQP